MPLRRRAVAPRPIDLRSDTVTLPTAEMRTAMAAAEVGDDVFGEDPSVNRLQDEAARLLGIEAALFVPSGTMGNQAALWALSGRAGGALVCEETSHVSQYECGAASLLSGLTLRTIRSPDGTFTPDDVARHIPPKGSGHTVPLAVVVVENTHNYAGGRCWSAAATRAVADFAHDAGAPLHLDGARLFNAAVAKGVSAASLVQGADSVMVCLSKGLGAPVGSLVLGSGEFIARARRVRKTLGGGMRQAGHLAAAGLVALRTGIDRLAEDHANAKLLAQGFAQVPGFRVDIAAVETNIVVADVAGTGLSSPDVLERLKAVGVLASTRDTGPTLRFVTHRNVSREDCAEAVERVAQLAPTLVARRRTRAR